jgi:hypothetical protein
MQDRFEAPPFARVFEDDGSQGAAVELAGRSDDVVAECATHGVEAWLAGFDDFAGEQVGIYELCAELCEHRSDRRFAACDPAREAHREQTRGFNGWCEISHGRSAYPKARFS